MRPRGARALIYSALLALAYATFAGAPPVARRPVAEVMQTVVRAPEWSRRIDTLGRGESLARVLQRSGLEEREAVAALRAVRTLDARRIPAGMPISVGRLGQDSLPSEVVLHIASDRLERLTRTDSGWRSVEERLAWTVDTVVVAGEITSTLYGAVDAGAPALSKRARAELAWELAEVFEYRLDMSRDLRTGDHFRVLVERSRAADGQTRIGNVLAVRFSVSGTDLEAIRYRARDGSGAYYDGQGRSLQAAFLRAPLSFRRISSVFGMRRHPILGVLKRHTGTDYAASSGTPVRTVGDGVVVHAGWRGGYGNTVEVRHRNGYVTRYGHLRAFASGVRQGSRVGIGRTIAFVGSTGLSTAPHLHFEVLVGGQQRDPGVALRMKGGFPLAAGERAAFEAARARALAALDAGDLNRLAQAD